MYRALYRKWRPQRFEDVVAQRGIVTALRNQVASGRVGHAYLFTGVRGTGKTTCAKIFAKAVNCLHPHNGDPCGECEICRGIDNGSILDVVEMDAASNNGVDDIRDLRDETAYTPSACHYKVYIIDEVHMLSSAAFNAFLKTLEEPPSYVIFILATTEKHKIIPTILSRCQIYDFSRITIADMVDHLEYVASQEGITAERPALGVIARKADGAMRDALSIFDQVAASSRGHITYQSTIENLNVLDERYYSRLVDAFCAGDVAQALLVYKEIRDHGFDSHFFINGLAQYMRDLMVARNPLTLPLLDTDEAVKEQMAQQAQKLEPDFFYSAMSLCNEADLNYRQASSKTFLVELLLIRLCQLNGPSPIYSGNGEGRNLQKIEVVSTQAETTAAAPAPAAAPRPQPAPQPQPVQATRTPAPAAPSRTPVAPAAPAQVTPVSTPLPPPPTPGGGRPARRPLGKGHVSLASAFAEPTPEYVTAAEKTAGTNRTPINQDNLLALWEDYMNVNPKAHVLNNTLRVHKPVPVNEADTSDASAYVVTVVNQSQVDVLEQECPRLLETLRRKLNNDFFDFSIALDESAAPTTAWSDREVLNHMVESSPYMAQFINDLKFTLS